MAYIIVERLRAAPYKDRLTALYGVALVLWRSQNQKFLVELFQKARRRRNFLMLRFFRGACILRRTILSALGRKHCETYQKSCSHLVQTADSDKKVSEFATLMCISL